MKRDAQAVMAALEAQRLVRYADLRPCYHAFVDTRTPGSEAKENFTIIGPGVSENPQQHVHITEPHGYNIGGARQPPQCVNSQHSHDTAEVFVVHTGRWRFDLGESGEDAQVLAGPGDLISLPVHVFRGFTNVGDDIGFLWSVLGEDDPGRVTWAPRVFDLASRYGLVLMENGRLIDTTVGEHPPAGQRPLPPTTASQVAAMRRVRAEEASGLLVAAGWKAEAPRVKLIGEGGPLNQPHGFEVFRNTLRAAETRDRRSASNQVVLFVHKGDLHVDWAAGRTVMGPGDTLTVPAGDAFSLASVGGAVVFEVQRAR